MKEDGKTDVRIIAAREGMATTVFTAESLGLTSTQTQGNRRRGKGIKGGKGYHRAVTTVLAGEATYDIERRIRDARRALGTAPLAFKELLPGDFDLTPEAVTMMPARPEWSAKLRRAALDARERKEFARWVTGVKQRLVTSGSGYAPAFEQNIDVWRQLWRVLERADVVVLVVDARNPMLHIPPALYAYVARRMGKPVVLVLNKVDLVPRKAAEKWAEHLLASLPGVDAIVGFSSSDGGGGAGGQAPVRGNIVGLNGSGRHQQPQAMQKKQQLDPAAAQDSDGDGVCDAAAAADDDDDDEEEEEEEEKVGGEEAAPAGQSASSSERLFTLRVGREALLEACHEVFRLGKRHPDTSGSAATAAEAEDPHQQSARGGKGSQQSRQSEANGDSEAAAALEAEEQEAAAAKAAGRVMVGLVGHPNAGKSSMVNYLLARKAVSVKATPGHTKILQTLILDDETCLCDSPGLVFPRLDASLAEQIIGGLVPLPVIREPYSSVRWLAEQRTAAAARWSAFASDNTRHQSDGPLAAALAAELPAALKTPPVTEYDPEFLELTGNEAVLDNEELPWSPMSLCHAFSRRRGFVRGGSPDTALAGQTILSMVLDGKLPYAVPPPDSSPVERQHTGTCSKTGEDNEGDEDDEEQEAEEEEEEDDGNGAVLNPFSALGIEDGDDSDGEEDEQQGADSVLSAAAGAAGPAVAPSRQKEKAGKAPPGGRRGGGGSSMLLLEEDAEDDSDDWSTKKTNKKGKKKGKR